MISRPVVFILSLLLPFAVWNTTLLAGQPPASPTDTEGQFGISIGLFTTLAAINAAGYDDGMDSPLNQRYQLRTQLRQELAKRNIPSLPALREFYKAHRKPTSAADLGQYISFALLSNGPPNFDFSEKQLPPDVAGLAGLSDLLSRFYTEANVEDLWNRSQQAYGIAVREYQDPVINSIVEANGYLRNPSGYLGRRFTIYLDLLGAPNQIQVRNYRDNYYIVITPTTAPVVDEIRDAYLAYLLDPLSLKYREVIKEKQALAKYAEEAPALDVAYKDDFSLLVTKSLIKAIDSRLTHGAAAREALVSQAMREGFVLTAAFGDLLPAYEKQQESLRIYYPDLVTAIDVHKEQKRLKTIEFAQSAAPRIVAPPAKLEVNPAEASLQAAEGVYEQGQYDNAAKIFKKVLEQTADKAIQGRAYYGLARIAVHENRKDEAVELFQRTADAKSDPAITAWAYVYLGRLALAAGDPVKAGTEFKTALAVTGASPLAQQAAQKGLQSTSGEKEQ